MEIQSESQTIRENHSIEGANGWTTLNEPTMKKPPKIPRIDGGLWLPLRLRKSALKKEVYRDIPRFTLPRSIMKKPYSSKGSVYGCG